MKKLFNLLVFLALAIPAFGQTQTTITGNVHDVTGVNATSGYVEFRLQPVSNGVIYRIAGVTLLNPTTSRCSINSSGNVAGLLGGACSVWGNPAVTPANTCYQVAIYPGTASKATVLPLQLISGGSYDLSSPASCPLLNIQPQDIMAAVPAFRANIVPAVDKMFTLGSPSFYYSAAYIDQAFINNLNVPMNSMSVRNINNIRYCDQFPGADGGAKVAACIADLPGTGGTADARGLQGPQNIGSTINSTTPITLLTGAATWSCTANPCVNSTAALTVIGAGRNVTVFKQGLRTNTFFSHANADPFQIKDATITSAGSSGDGQTAGCGISITGSGGANSNNRSLVENVQFLFQWTSICAGNTAHSKIFHDDFNGVEFAGIQLLNTYSSDEGDNVIETNTFSPDNGLSTVYGVYLVSSGAPRIIDNKFQENFKCGTYVHWTGQGVKPDTVILAYLGNQHEWPLTGGAGVCLDDGNGTTGSITDLLFVGNRFISVANDQTGIKFASNTRQVFSRGVISGNIFDFIAGTSNMISLGGHANGDVIHISGNDMYGGVGTGTALAVNQTAGTLYSSVDLGANNYQGAVSYFTQTGDPTIPFLGHVIPEPSYFGFTAFPGISTNPLNIPNNKYYGGLSSAAGYKRFIGQDGSDNLQIGIDNQPVKAGGTTGSFTVTGNGGLVVSYNSLIGGSEQVNGNFKTLASAEVAGLLKMDSPCFAANVANVQACGSKSTGVAVIAAGQPGVQITTTSVTATSRILVTFDQTQSANAGVTCNSASTSQAAAYYVSANNGSTTFNINTTVLPVTNPACVNWWVIN